MKPWMLGLVALVTVAALGKSRRLVAFARQRMLRRRQEEAGMAEEDIQRFVNEGGAPLGAGAE